MNVVRTKTLPVTRALAGDDALGRLLRVILGRPHNPPTTFHFILEPSPDHAWRKTFKRFAKDSGFTLQDGQVMRVGCAHDQKRYEEALDRTISKVNCESGP